MNQNCHCCTCWLISFAVLIAVYVFRNFYKNYKESQAYRNITEFRPIQTQIKIAKKQETPAPQKTTQNTKEEQQKQVQQVQQPKKQVQPQQKQPAQKKEQNTSLFNSEELILKKTFQLSSKISNYSIARENPKHLAISTFDGVIRFFNLTNDQFTTYRDPDYEISSISLSTTRIAYTQNQRNSVCVLAFNKSSSKLEPILKLKDNIHKQIQSTHIDEKYIWTIGGDNDTFIRLFSVQGQQIFQVNTSSSEHLISCYNNNLLALGSWTPDTRLFQIIEKQGQFSSVQKLHALGHKSSVVHIDIHDQYVASYCKGSQFNLGRVDQDSKIVMTKNIEDVQQVGVLKIRNDIYVCIETENSLLLFKNFQQVKSLVMNKGFNFKLIEVEEQLEIVVFTAGSHVVNIYQIKL